MVYVDSTGKHKKKKTGVSLSPSSVTALLIIGLENIQKKRIDCQIYDCILFPLYILSLFS